MVSHCFNLHLPDDNQCGTTFLILFVIYIFSLMLYLVAQFCLTLCDPMDCSPPGPYVHDILQARILKWIAMSSFRWPSQPRDQRQVSRIAGGFFTIWANREALFFGMFVKVFGLLLNRVAHFLIWVLRVLHKFG